MPTNQPATTTHGDGSVERVRGALDRLLADARTAAAAASRTDLVDRIDRAVARHADHTVTALVAGEFKQGKSTLVNALLNVGVCGVADDVSTVVPTTLRHGAEASAVVHYAVPGDGTATTTEPIEVDRVAELGTEQGNPGNRHGIRAIEVTLPRRLLARGLTVVDSPGVGGLDASHAASTNGAMRLAELVLFVSDASQPLTASEVAVLRDAAALCDEVVLVQTKTDIQPAWRRIVTENERILREQGLDLRIIPVSSVLRQRAAAESSTELNDESGFPALITLLRDASSGEVARRALRTALADVAFVADQLASTVEPELAALDDPASADAVLGRLEDAKQRADRLRSQSAKWQQTLNDGAQDLTSDLDHDLRQRFRAIVAESDAVFEEQDPVDMWDDFEQWLHRRIGFDLAAHHQLIADRANSLATVVADHFAEDEAALGVDVHLALKTITAKVLREQVKLERAGLSGNALAAVRGSYGGLLMFGMVGQMAGLALLNPFSVLIGLGLGRRGLREEKRRQLLQRQQQAKMTVRKYLDDINLEASKVSRDAIRLAHRELRDEFASRADQLQATIRESIRSAEAATKEAMTERQQRLQAAKAEHERATAISARAGALAADLVTPVRAAA